MATDDALLARARESGEAVFRVYSWATPVLSFGRNQRALGIYDEAELDRRGITVVRRPTGGRALLHHREVTYSVTAPVDAAERLLATYKRINGLLLDALAACGVAAAIAQPETRAIIPGEQPCFAEPAAGEIVVDGRKLVGSAQWRDDGALLQHGSILVADDQSIIPQLMRSPVAPPPTPAGLAELMGRQPNAAELAEALFAEVRRTLDPSASPLGDGEVLALRVTSIANRYRDPAWTWRR
ncbi:MAG: hypothetical protein ABJE47_21040 [bacterium]